MHERKMSKRSLVRLISFATAIIIVLGIAATIGFFTAKRYRTTVEYTYQRALTELTEYVRDMDVSLDKGRYVNTPKQAEGLSTKLWNDAKLAKDSLSLLPVESEEISTTSKFLSQVGNFSMSLATKAVNGIKISEEEMSMLEELSALAKKVSEALETLSNKIDNGELKLGEVKKGIENDFEDEQVDAGDSISGFEDIEENFGDYPTLIYDGPFSDHIQQYEPKYLKGKNNVSENAALDAAKKVSGHEDLTSSGESAGKIPAYIFTNENVTVSVSKAGGEIISILNSAMPNEPVYSYEEAVALAEEKLRSMGHDNFAMRYYEFSHGVLTINFALKQGDIICYPDLVKIGIALDTGEMHSLDTKGFLFNSVERSIPSAKISIEEAQNIVSPKLSIKSSAIALVPSDHLSEVLCYEFNCVGEDDEPVLVYIDVQTGMEEQILILQIDESGILAS